MTSPYLDRPLRSRIEAAYDLAPELKEVGVNTSDKCDHCGRASWPDVAGGVAFLIFLGWVVWVVWP